MSSKLNEDRQDDERRDDKPEDAAAAMPGNQQEGLVTKVPGIKPS